MAGTQGTAQSSENSLAAQPPFQERAKQNESNSSDSDVEILDTMEAMLKPPSPMVFEGNIKENWLKWKQSFTLYLKATGLDKKDEERKVAVLLCVIGDEAVEKYNTFGLSESEAKVLKNVIDKFEEFCVPKSNETVDRHLFFARSQQIGESFDDFLTDLKKLSAPCEFAQLKDTLIRDRIVGGIRGKSLKERLLREDELTLEKAVSMCRITELADFQLKTLNEESNIHAITSKPKSYTKGGQQQKAVDREAESASAYSNFNKQRNESPQQNSWNPRQNRTCQRCGYTHERRQCPAYGKTCAKCQGNNHFAKMCKSKNVQVIVNDDVSDAGDDLTLFMGCVNSKENLEMDWLEKLTFNGKTVMAKLDTGAQCNVMPLDKYKELDLHEQQVVKSTNKLCNYNGTQINVVGKIELKCQTKKMNKVNVEFQVVDCGIKSPVVLGLPSLQALNLVQRVNVIRQETPRLPKNLKKYEDIFNGIGCISDFEYEIKIKPDAVGKVDACRTVPIKLLEPLKLELKKMEKMGIIERQIEPTEWVNSLVIVKKKDGNLRICLDPHNLNKEILRQYHQIPNFENLCAKMPGATFFSTLEADKAFWQVKLTEQSSKLTTFNTPFGRYKFNRMPYGICSASEVFQACFQRMFSDPEGVIVYIDNILIWGKNKEEHDMRLDKVLQRIRENGVKLNYEKCKIGVTEVNYVGHIFSKDGLKPDDEKIRAILEMKKPENREQLESFLGMLTYLSRYIPNVSQKNAVLRNL